jgi:single-strand DNA-binding protein
MSVNKAIIVGYLGRDPETRFTGSGTPVCNFSVATDESYKDKSGEKQKKVEWHKIVVWQKLADICQQYLKKGSLVYIEGRIQTKEWTDKKSGEKKTDKEIVASVMRMLGGKPGEKNGDPTTGAEPAAELPEETDSYEGL